MRRKTFAALLLILAVVLGAAYAAYLGAKFEDNTAWVPLVTGGDRSRAPPLLVANGCTGCHSIPGIPGAAGTVGPDLANYANRGYIGGALPNTAHNLVSWIRHSRDIDPKTAMPNTNVSEQAARDMAAYLYDPCTGADLWTGICRGTLF